LIYFSEFEASLARLGLRLINLLLSEITEIGSRTVWVEVAQGGSTTHSVLVSGVVSMLHFHAGIVADIDVVAPCLLLGEVVLDAHVDVEGLVRFLLAVLDAGQFSLLFRRHEVNLDAVLVALFEENFRESMLL